MPMTFRFSRLLVLLLLGSAAVAQSGSMKYFGANCALKIAGRGPYSIAVSTIPTIGQRFAITLGPQAIIYRGATGHTTQTPTLLIGVRPIPTGAAKLHMGFRYNYDRSVTDQGHCSVLVDPLLMLVPTITWRTPFDGTWNFLDFDVPNDPSLVGVKLFAQWWIRTIGQDFSYTWIRMDCIQGSNATEITIGR